MTSQVPQQHLEEYRKQEPCVYPVYGILRCLNEKPIVIQGYSVQHVLEILAANRNVGGFEFDEAVAGVRLYTLMYNEQPATLRVYENPDVLY